MSAKNRIDLLKVNLVELQGELAKLPIASDNYNATATGMAGIGAELRHLEEVAEQEALDEKERRQQRFENRTKVATLVLTAVGIAVAAVFAYIRQ